MDSPGYGRFDDYGLGGDYSEYFKKLFGGDLFKKPEYEPLSMLSVEDQEEWNMLNNKVFELQSEIREYAAKLDLFYTKLERLTKIYDRKLIVENGMIMVEKKPDPKTNKPKDSSGLNDPFDDYPDNDSSFGR